MANVSIPDSFQRIQFYGKPDANGNIYAVANVLASETGNLISYIPGENIEFTVDQTSGNILINAPSYTPVVDYWRTFRDFTTNASIIADQSQDVLTFRGGDNISLEFNEGDDIITWHADISSAAEGLRSNLSVVNSNVTSDPSMLEYDPSTGIFTYYPPDLSKYATENYVYQSINDAITNLDLSEYATQKWVEDYITDNVIPLIPDVSDYVTQQDFNNWMATINNNVLTPPSFTFGNLPTNPPLGIRYYVTDSNVSVQGNFGSTNFVGGGSNIVPVYYTTSPSGNVWIIG